MDDRQFFALCQLNRDLRIERTVEGDILIMPSTAGSTGRRNFRLAALFGAWEERDRSGQCFDSSPGFRLPNGATRSPDLAWVRQERLDALSAEDWETFLPLCPDFVLELRLPSDALGMLQDKMAEYLETAPASAGCSIPSRSECTSTGLGGKSRRWRVWQRFLENRCWPGSCSKSTRFGSPSHPSYTVVEIVNNAATMATVNFSVPDDVKREFNELFAGENKSAVLAQLMRRAIAERKRARRRAIAVERILQLRETAPSATDEQLNQARDALRE